MRLPSMPTLFGSSSPGYADPDPHTKLQVERLHRSKTDTMRCIVRTLSASKALHQVLGLRDPEPFVLPPSLPSDLTERFELGILEHNQLQAGAVLAPAQQGKKILEDILEEKENPVRPSPTLNSKSSTSSKLTISAPKYPFGKQAVAAALRFSSVGKSSDPTEDVTSQDTDYESNEDCRSWTHGSSTILAASDHSRPGSPQTAQSLPPPSFPPRTRSLLPLPNFSNGNATASPQPLSISKKLPAERRHASSRPIAPEKSQLFSGGDLGPTHVPLRRSESLPVLFPSPGVAQTFTESVHNELARRYGSKYVDADAALESNSSESTQDTVPPPAPRITIQAPSPVKTSKSRKRAPSLTTQEGLGPPLTQRSRREDATGLPVLPPEAEAEWKADFPGNTCALMTILLTWSHTTWSLYRRLHDPKLFSRHPAFAYPISPPLRRQLLSVSFYDTSVEPHKEVRFLGPGDAAEMSYNEVDVFEDPNSRTNCPAPPRGTSSVGTMKQTLGLMGKDATTHKCHMTMSQRAKTGQGRWCYVLLKGHSPPDGSTPPYLMLAWHISAVTSTSNSIHTVYTESFGPGLSPTPQRNKVKRFSSLQDLGQTLRSPAKFEFRQNLRAASSSSGLTLADSCPTFQQQEGITLHRTVVMLQKAGRIPLIEGYKVDIAAFKGWMEARGRGEGKVILWGERGGE